MNLKEIQTDLMRRTFPMTAYWRFKQAMKRITDFFLLPFVVANETTKAASETLQEKVFHKEKK